MNIQIKNLNQLKWIREQFLCVTELRRPSFSCWISPAVSDSPCDQTLVVLRINSGHLA